MRGGERHGDLAGVPGEAGSAEVDARGVPETDTTRLEDARPNGFEGRAGKDESVVERETCAGPTGSDGSPRSLFRSGDERSPMEVGQGGGEGDAGGVGVPKGSTWSAE
jgi:hypothetical protein